MCEFSAKGPFESNERGIISQQQQHQQHNIIEEEEEAEEEEEKEEEEASLICVALCLFRKTAIEANMSGYIVPFSWFDKWLSLVFSETLEWVLHLRVPG